MDYKKINILKLDGNIRGNIAEEIAKYIIKNCIRCKNHNPKILDFTTINKEQKEFLRKYWKYIDLIRITSKVEIIEVKSRKYFIEKYSWKKHPITPYGLKIFEDAQSIGLKVSILEIIFDRNWTFFYRYRDFNKNIFSISSSRGAKARRSAGYN